MKADTINRADESGARGKVCLQISNFEQVGHRYIKLYSSVIHIETDFPSFTAGTNSIFFAASMHASVIPFGRAEAM
jgi:hypothetical protein